MKPWSSDRTGGEPEAVSHMPIGGDRAVIDSPRPCRAARALCSRKGTTRSRRSTTHPSQSCHSKTESTGSSSRAGATRSTSHGTPSLWPRRRLVGGLLRPGRDVLHSFAVEQHLPFPGAERLYRNLQDLPLPPGHEQHRLSIREHGRPSDIVPGNQAFRRPAVRRHAHHTCLQPEHDGVVFTPDGVARNAHV